MSKSRKHSVSGKSNENKYLADDGKVYLDKRTVVRYAQSAGRDAADRATKVMGYAIVAEGGWVVKKYPDGNKEKIHRIG